MSHLILFIDYRYHKLYNHCHHSSNSCIITNILNINQIVHQMRFLGCIFCLLNNLSLIKVLCYCLCSHLLQGPAKHQFDCFQHSKIHLGILLGPPRQRYQCNFELKMLLLYISIFHLCILHFCYNDKDKFFYYYIGLRIFEDK